MKHVKKYQELFEAQTPLTQEQIEWLDECTKEKGMWSYNTETGLVDVDCTFNCSKQNLTDFKGVKFGRVKGDFWCQENQLTSLEGAPQSVGSGFYCANNQLTSLKGAPQKVGRDLHCYGNQLTSLEGLPEGIRNEFLCWNNPVSDTTLKALYKRMKSGMSWEEAVEMQWDDMDEDDRALVAQYNPRLTPEEIREYQALARLKKRVL
jgi:hypothetical protein